MITREQAEKLAHLHEVKSVGLEPGHTCALAAFSNASDGCPACIWARVHKAALRAPEWASTEPPYHVKKEEIPWDGKGVTPWDKVNKRFGTPMPKPILKMVIGLLFTPQRSQVVLIQKNAPYWQKGLLNGVGGKVAQGESPLRAMHREFYEEAGVPENIIDWEEFAQIHALDQSWIVYCYRAFADEAFDAKTIEDEAVFLIDASIPPNMLVSNLTFLIPLARDNEGIVFPRPVILYDNKHPAGDNKALRKR